MPKFEPSVEQREEVATLASVGTPQEEIAKSIVNPRTGRGVSVKVLRRLFKKELAEDTELKKEIISEYREMVRDRHPWAIKFGMETIVGANAAATATTSTTAATASAETTGITVRFVPPPHSDEPPPIAWPQNLKQLQAPREPVTIDSRDEHAVRPLYHEVKEERPPAQAPAPYNSGGTLLRGNSPYATEMDDPNNPYDDRKRSRPWRPLGAKKGPNGWMR